MQLDRTHLTVRARTFSEIGDLSLLLLRRYPGAIAIGFVVGALPWACFNALLLGHLPWAEFQDGIVDEETFSGRIRYVSLMAVLVFLQTPLAGCFTTYYLGQAVFEQRPTWRNVFGACWQVLGRLLWSCGVYRLTLPVMLVLALNWGGEFEPFSEAVLLPFALMLVVALRSLRPFAPEILLLERCPFRSRASGTITARQRSHLLHSPLSGELIGRYFLLSVMTIALTTCIFLGLLSLRGFFFAQWNWLWHHGDWLLPDVALLWYPLALWLVGALSVFFRFLSYLDARIRLEGWEVELLIRAEAARQRGTHQVHRRANDGRDDRDDGGQRQGSEAATAATVELAR